jgi:hypothetical protein
MEQERAPKGTKDLFTKRIRSVARGAYSGSKRTGHANKWKQELKDGYNGKGAYVSKIGNKSMHTILS